MTKFLLCGAMLAAIIAITPASAQAQQRGAGAQAHTRAQLAVRVQSMFQRLDANRDGFITRDESQVAKANRGNRQARQAQRAQRSPEQRAAKRANAFARIDANRDGMLSREEFARAPGGRQQRIAGANGQNRRSRQASAGGLRRGGGMGMSSLRGQMFEMADINRDARVSLQEATAAAYRHFDMADANRDGQVTREERKAIRQRMRGANRNG